MSKQPFNAGHLIQDIIYGTTPWGYVDNAFGNPLPRLHLARVDSAAEDVTARVDPNDPNNHEISAWTRALLGLKPDMKARDLQNDRARFYTTDDGKALERSGAISGYPTIDKNNKYKNTHSLAGDIVRAGPNIEALANEEVTYGQLGLQNAGTGPNGEPVSPTIIAQRAGAFKSLRDVTKAIKVAGETPKPGASFEELQLQLKDVKVKNKKAAAALDEEIYRESTLGKQASELHDEQMDTSQSTRKVNEGNLELNRTNSTNAQEQQEYINETNNYRYEDNKIEKGLQRKWEAAREDARHAANLEQVRAQNAAEMERYELMLQNDREVSQGDNISDLIAALTMLSGSFLT